MHRIIYDCDNTMGLKDKDVDDGLTLMYLIGNENVELIGLTSTHGNGTVEEVHENNLRIMNLLDKEYKPIFKGGDLNTGRISEAAKFLAISASRYKGEITILATGSMSNLYGAYLYDENFYKNVKNIVLMGGITKPLLISGVEVRELNLSCDYEASYSVLTSGADITILDGHVTLQALFREKELNVLKNSSNEILRYVYKEIEPWFNSMEKTFNIKAFCNWDASAAMYITNKEIFNENFVYINPDIEELKSGIISLSEKDNGFKVNMPNKIIDLDKFNSILIEKWGKL
ncbi:nucleoside hydrolase [Clostridium sporogenes]|jgi:inosine-uridine nucleoside N-ribohydrolase|uniref:Nucleoside hydrolase n=1 Tax=Clostridium sporogenes TaxID=1509 RepID=A0ABD6RMH7_CLOSG|nr:nucleoside hydrolase [Clostridium sporogenes]MBE6077672.1 nucleoside hydrolase [Clostridium lundense]MCW6092783.1 nucleoside hydrolase [Clostridium sporogenes]NFE66026.1 nucleoside hydrolase [Clostridium sporogenes]OSB16797.1 nucleoside hydrolase [Clostridium sporogenes]